MTTVTITGTFTNALDGAPLQGAGHLAPTEPVILDASVPAVRMLGQDVTLDPSGSFSVDVLANDSAGLYPPGFTYTFHLRLSDGSTFGPYRYAVSSAAAPTVDVTALTPVQDADGVSYVAVGGTPVRIVTQPVYDQLLADGLIDSTTLYVITG